MDRAPGGSFPLLSCTQTPHGDTRHHSATRILSPETRVRIPVAVPHRPHSYAGFLFLRSIGRLPPPISDALPGPHPTGSARIAGREPPVPVRGQEPDQGGEHRVRSLLGDPVCGVGQDPVCTSSATSSSVLPTCSPKLSAPPIARTGIVSRRVLRCSFCAWLTGKARSSSKLPRGASRSARGVRRSTSRRRWIASSFRPRSIILAEEDVLPPADELLIDLWKFVEQGSATDVR